MVIDASTDALLEGAYVSVATSNWGSLTTDNGRFLLCDIGPGNHVVTAERLGYVTLIVQVESDASGGPVHLQMMPDPILLEGLEIVTDRFAGRRRATASVVQVYDQEELAGAATGRRPSLSTLVSVCSLYHAGSATASATVAGRSGPGSTSTSS